jgi:hypothetical protein
LPAHDTDRIHSLKSAFPQTHHGVRHSDAAALRSRALERASANDTRRRPRWHMEQQIELDADRRCTHTTPRAEDVMALTSAIGLLRPQGRATD